MNDYFKKHLAGANLFHVAVAGLTLCLLLLGFAFQGARGIWQPDEGYYVGTAVTMDQNHDLLVPLLGEEIFLEKPPALYWGIIAGLKAFGHNEFAVRAFSGLCYVLTSVMVGMIAFTLFGEKRLAIISSFIYATMAIPFIAANFITPDTPLALWTAVSIFCFIKSIAPDTQKTNIWKMLLCGAVGVAFLSKGPAGLIPCGAMFVFLVLTKKAVRYFFTPWSILGILIFAITGLSWYAYVSFKVPGALSYFFDNQVMGRLVTEKYDRNSGFFGMLIYVPVLVFGTLPWSVVFWQKLSGLKSNLLSGNKWKALFNQPEMLFVACWIFVPLAILCAASSRLPLYPLPVFPAIAILAAKLYDEKIPVLSALSAQERFRLAYRPLMLSSVWIIVLIGARLGLAYYPSAKDSRQLWGQISAYIDQNEYEIVTVNKRADGLLFYGAREVESITDKDHPYPSFEMPESVERELVEMPLDPWPHLFLIDNKKHLDITIDKMKKTGRSFKQIALDHGKWLVVCNSVAGEGKKMF